ncbi:hypothetical protein ASPWEDRAFT_36455 [Aspergillus wentii DTO 134E9]|uniref:Uncharacterized protein n=1 Tax=Aspergillus wentii DTO 134E9 TaxID=1073089 RepID=A0A1L9RV94_ASPWE|nr:uncharacterized protein ASPWEDRAFT_36455 [Aspergillus wentii DTO 134E9]OJJ38778.1 hypothetical protein ASPWEDRAFT_36455 [Aspergillus wentii DTO 134E9]
MPLLCTAEEGHTAIIHMLLESSENVNEKDIDSSKSALIHKAAYNRHVVLGSTTLGTAITIGKLEIVKLLLNCPGSDIKQS